MVKIGSIGEFTTSLVREITGSFEESELESRLNTTLQKLNILEDGETLVEYNEIYGWKRGGAETYVAAANVKVQKDGQVYDKPFVSKAIVTTLPAIKTESMLRSIGEFKRSGINMARLYSATNATLYQQFIPFSVEEAVSMGAFNDELLDRLAFMAAQLDRNGYSTLGFISDIRTDLKDFYYVDFGFDLGSARDHQTDSSGNDLEQFMHRNKSLRDKKDYVMERYRYHLNNPPSPQPSPSLQSSSSR